MGTNHKVIIVSNTEWYLYNFRRSLIEHLKNQGLDVVLVSPSGPYASKLEALGFRWIPWEVGRKTLAPWKEFGAILQLARIYWREKPDLVHHHTIKPTLYGSLVARFSGIRGIANSITGRGYVFLGDDIKIRLLRQMVKGIYKLAFSPQNSVVIFENTTDQAYFVKNDLISASRTRLIESVGVDPQQFFPRPEPNGVPVILQASRMLWDKGVGVLVDAARLLHQRVEVRVALAGNPDPGNPASIPETMLRDWHEEGLIEWWGFRSDMNEVYNSSHVVTLPSIYAEGVPTALLEAASCGRPVATTNIPGCKDFVMDGYNGLLVPPNDPAALAGALEKLATNPELRASLGAAGRQRVLEKYTTAQVNAATLAVYQGILGIR